MVTSRIQELAAARAKIETLEREIAAQLNKELAALPAQFGFDNASDFIAAVRAAGRKGARSVNKNGSKRRTRAVITDATRAEVKKLVEAGKTGGEIAKAVGISLPSVQNIKKALGLVRKKGK